MLPRELAEFFHDTYERLAPQFGYETRPDTKAFDHESPNGKLMIAVADAVLVRLAAQDTDVKSLTPNSVGLGEVDYVAAQVAAVLDAAKNQAVTPVDPRWLALARTQFQTAFMSLRRSLFPNRSNTI